MQPIIPLPLKPKIVSENKNNGVFEIENLYPGYGITLGNALRRVILGSIPGAAITSIKIKNVSHEFSAIAGVLEDVIEIILNIKQIRVKLMGDEQQKLSLKTRGIKEVKAGDIEVPSQVEILSKDQHIATLTDKKAELEIDMVVERGLGYEPAESRRKEKLEIGTIALDAIFTPIRKVNFELENMRVGDRADFNRLFITIETDGSVTPSEAFNKGVEILVSQFNEFFPETGSPRSRPLRPGEEVSGNEASKKEEAVVSAEKPVKEKPEKEKRHKKEKEDKEGGVSAAIEDQSVRYLELSTRLTNVLLESGIKTIGKLMKKKEKFLLELNGIGEKGVEEIKDKLTKQKLSLRK